MVTKRIRSEYMKKFKDPKWETYTKCYEEMLKYRLTRRLLEQTHNPWFWNGSDSDSESGGKSPPHHPPHPLSKNQVRCEANTEAEQEESEGSRTERLVPRLLLPDEGESVSAKQPALRGSQLEGARESGVPEEEEKEERGEQRASSTHRALDQEGDPGVPHPQRSKPPKMSKRTWRSQRVRPAPALQPKEESKDSKHPFALYGSGEKDADIAGRKTHNVGPSASTTQIHESALRAKTRREVERQIQTQRTERRRAKSADLDKAKKLVQPEFNPWLTEYMRCFSARSR
ncbi:centriole, cilia and spindle-associated protein [Scomber scombrus]|uniref:centriole, cilia and spindle-associated protein n=1 Tax=Scomber scombrus TaxID=13677 RepID=UPI002DDAC414|nr:centriole, cilia and spindle-associated protein [Scomber scombrus]